MTHDRVKVVALGGGHGLATTLTALRDITSDLTAIVTVADDGGSSGRLRRDFGIIPPGDLRMALAALCGREASGWADVIQHRFPGDGPLAGHAVGNLLLAALWQLHGDPVAGLDAVAQLLHLEGRVLPMAAVPLSIHAQVEGQDGQVRTVIGQVAVATASGRICSIGLEPADPAARPEALSAITEADWVTLGPGSWYSSVIAHLLVPEQRAALRSTRAGKILILNIIRPEDPGDEARAEPAERLLEVLHEHAPDLSFDIVLADPVAIVDHDRLVAGAARMGATVVLGDMSTSDGRATHDADRLSTILRRIMLDQQSAAPAPPSA